MTNVGEREVKIKKITIELNINDERQRCVYEKVIYRDRYAYRTQTDYIVAAISEYEEPQFPVVQLADEERARIVHELQEALKANRVDRQPGV